MPKPLLPITAPAMPNSLTPKKVKGLYDFDWSAVNYGKKNTFGLGDQEINNINAVKENLLSFGKTLQGQGYSKEQSAGILGNLFHESGFKPDTMQRGGGPGFGIAQWNKVKTDPRYKGLNSTAQKYKLPVTDYKVQTEFLLNELKAADIDTQRNSWGGVGRRDKFLQTTDTNTASDSFAKLFLRPKAETANLERRRQYSNYIYSML